MTWVYISDQDKTFKYAFVPFYAAVLFGGEILWRLTNRHCKAKLRKSFVQSKTCLKLLTF